MSAQRTGQVTLSALNLWEAALKGLEPEERAIIKKHDLDTKPTEVLKMAEKKHREAWDNRTCFTGPKGVVFLYDIFAKVAGWVRKFIEVGDVAVQYDPAHAALPWAAMRFILQASINDIQRRAAVLEIVKDVAQAMPLGAIHERLYLTKPSAAAESLKTNLRKLYTLCWSSLAKALRYYDQSKMKRVLKSVLDLESDMDALSEQIANQWILIERSATLVRTEGLISHISESQTRDENILQMMDDIRMPVSRIEAYVEETQDTLGEMKRDRILDSISTIPYPQHHAKVSRNVLPGTGKWLLDHQVVKNWFSSSASEILWLHGIPGSGKSCLVSVMLEKLIEESAYCPFSYPVYFYCNRNSAETERADPTSILRSILRQLSTPRSTKTLPRSIMDKFDKERGSFLDLGDTRDLIIDTINSRSITYIVLDALDECDAKSRDDLTGALEFILRGSQRLVKMFVSSRNDWDLECWLRDYPNKEILSSDNGVDLAAFVDDEVDRRVDGKPRRLLRGEKISDALRDDIKQTLKAQAQGMFRWAELQLQYLCKLFSEEDIRKRLGALPKDLMGIYDDIYQRNMSELRDTDPQYEADAKKIFHLMLSTNQPWDPVDMANMLEPAPIAAHRQPDKVFGLTFHLITHDKELNVLRFAHLSVREYFENNLSEFTFYRTLEASVAACFDYLEKTRDMGFRPLSYPSQRWFTDVAILSHKEVSAQFAHRLTQFLVYDIRAFESWLKEMVEIDGGIITSQEYISADTLTSRDGTTIFAACILGLRDIVSDIIDTKPSSVHARNLEGDSPLLVACTWTNRTNIVSLLLQKGAAVNERVGRAPNLTALGAALSVAYPSIAVIRKLLENGADPNLVGRETREGALRSALYRGNSPVDTVRNILEASGGVKVSYDTLRFTVQAGFQDVTAALLSFGAEVNAPDAETDGTSYYNDWDIHSHPSVLFLAIDREQKQIAQQLLFHGANPVPRNEADRTIFERLLYHGDTELARSLLVAPNQDLRATTMIQAARLLGEDELMTQLKILEEKKPDEQELHKAIDVAAERGLMKVFKRLVDHSYDCSLLYSSKCRALAGTARRGQVDMFKILWTSLLRNRPTSGAENDLPSAESGNSDTFIVSLHAPTEFGSRTGFSFLLYDAATGGSTDIFQLILTEGEMRTTDRDGGLDEFPVSTTSSATTLITDTNKHELFTDEIRDNGPWYLHAAVKASQADMVDMLLRLGADANVIAQDCHEQNALCTALIERKDRDIIKLLLMGGADVNAQLTAQLTADSRWFKTLHGTALTMALFRGNEHKAQGIEKLNETPATVIELLLQHGADANATDDMEGSILQLAISQEHIGATELLLAYGADVNKGGGAAGSPLIAAVASEFDIGSRVKLTEILLKNGADANKSGGDCRYGSPLIAAVLSQGYSKCTGLIELLLNNGADVNAEHSGLHSTAFRAALSTSESIGQHMFQLLLTHGADVSATGRDGTQALYVACASGGCDEPTAEYLLSQGADVNACGGEYGNALQAACATSCPSTTVELLIAKGAEVNAKGGRFGNALQAASHAGCLRTVQILLANGADLHANDGEYGHALQAAAISRKPVPTMKLLLSHGANINAVGGKYGTALYATCAHDLWGRSQSAARNLLLSRGADSNVRGGKYGYALICVIADGVGTVQEMTGLVSLLLDSGADINCSHEEHGNALYAACRRFSEPLMKMLIERGISVTQLAGEHEHALFLACQERMRGKKDDELARVLLDNGVDVNIRGRRYSCALEVAIKAWNFGAAKLLIERGADVHVETANDGSLLDIAVQSLFGRMVRLLRANGA